MTSDVVLSVQPAAVEFVATHVPAMACFDAWPWWTAVPGPMPVFLFEHGDDALRGHRIPWPDSAMFAPADRLAHGNVAK
jgi:hypothetical protein